MTAYTAMTTRTTSAKMTDKRLNTGSMSYTAHLKNPATAFPSTSGQVTVTCAKTLQYEHHKFILYVLTFYLQCLLLEVLV